MNPINDREIDDHTDQRVIDQVLTEVDPDSAESLRPLLAELRTLAHGETVEPGPLLEALLLPEETALVSEAHAAVAAPPTVPVLRVIDGDGPGQTAGLRRPARPARRRRPLAAALVLTAAIGAGTAAAAAADEGFRSTLNDGLNSVIRVLGGHAANAPASPATPAPTPAPAAPAERGSSPASAPATSPSTAATPHAETPAPSSAATSAPRTTTGASTASPSPKAGLPGLPTQLPSPNLGVPLPKLPPVPGALPTAPTGLPGSLN